VLRYSRVGVCLSLIEFLSRDASARATLFPFC
jgi:hypothetical protein